jgi:ribosomal peptide maturation radical SAM protein 1
MRITLINMPFASLQCPSFALTQLQSLVRAQFGEAVSVRVLYLNHDCAERLGTSLYSDVANLLDANMSALGDWFFKRAAFPDAPDDVETYFRRFFPGETGARYKSDRLLDERAVVDAVLDGLIDRYDLANDDLVGFTSMFCQNLASFALARKLKARRPAIVTVMGGANCETPMGQQIVHHVTAIDFVFSGPALNAFPQFVRCCLERNGAGRHRIRGVFSRANLPFVGTAGAIGEELDINVHVPLDYAPFLESLSRFPDVDPVLTFETSRGCWWGERAHCTFCGLNGMTMAYRAMAPAAALAQFEALFAYSPRCRVFMALDNIMPRSYLEDVWPALEPPGDSSIFYEVKADLTPAELGTLARAHVTVIQPGIESFATSTLKLMKKGTSAFQNITFLKNCLTYGISPSWNLLFGFPGEGADVYLKYMDDLPSLVHLPAPCGAFPVRYDRYSPYFVRDKEYGLDLYPAPVYGMLYPFPPESLRDLAYYFVDRHYAAPHVLARLEHARGVVERVEAWRTRWDLSCHPAPPALEFATSGDRLVVRDSRGGDPAEYDLGPDLIAMLRFLDQPRRTAELLAEAASIGVGDPVAALSMLKAKRLLFGEDDRWLSLVVDPIGAPAHERRDPRRAGVPAEAI